MQDFEYQQYKPSRKHPDVMVKVLFLDIDGVLHPAAEQGEVFLPAPFMQFRV